MDSIKSIVVVAILLGVLYGIYQVINDDDSPVAPDSTNLIAEFDKESSKASEDSSQKNSNEKSTESDSANSDADANYRVKLDPPPSTFDPKQTKFVYPKKKENGFGESANRDIPSSVFGAQADKKGVSLDDKSQTADPKNSAETRSGSAGSGATGDGIYRPKSKGAFSKEEQSSGSKEINDPRNRFVTGSFADFERQVRGDMELAEEMIRKSDFVGALKLLTKFYDDPRLTTEENQNLVSWLDPLAGKVVYSVEHHLLEPYYVRQNDTLNLLSVKFAVPPELIFNINRVAIPDQTKLVPGTELKMVKGPFNAEISLSKNKMTLFVKGMYAGTFKIRIGNEPRPKTGKYRVLSKSRLGQDYSDKNYQRIDALDPRNPYGKYYLNIGGGMALHGSAQVSDSQDTRGCISLNAVDAEDVHNILTTESTVTIVE